MKHKGLFIVFEGLDGSGSSTQASMLKDYLKTFGLSPHVTKEPTNNLIGGLIRGALTKEWQPSIQCLELLFAADRAHHLDREIIPSLKAGKVVISDRYFFSTIAFGSIECSAEWLKSLNRNFLDPDLTFLIKVPPEECIRRIGKSRFEFELFEEVEKLNKVWFAYEALAKEHDNVFIIDGTQPVEVVHKRIISILQDYLTGNKTSDSKDVLES